MGKLIGVVLMAAAGLVLVNMPATACANCPLKKGGKAEKLCPSHMAGVDTSKEKVADGLAITMTAVEKETVAGAQAAAAAHYADSGKNCKCVPKGAEVKLENIENGVKVVITGKSPKLIKRIQAKADNAHNCGHKKTSTETGNAKPTAVSAQYVCPMGCAQADKPGKCPKCGMDMTEKKQ